MGEEDSKGPPNCINAPLIFLDWSKPVTEAKRHAGNRVPYLPIAIQLIGKFYFAKRYGSLHPVGPKVGRVWMDVDTAVIRWLGLANWYPFSVHILPAVAV